MAANADNPGKPVVLLVGPSEPLFGGIANSIRNIRTSDLNRTYELPFFDTFRAKRRGTVFASRLSWSNVWATGRLIRDFLGTLAETRPAVVHVQTSSYWGFWEKSLLVALARRRGARAILHVRGAEFDKFYGNLGPAGRRLARYCLNLPERVIVLSASWGRFFGGLIRPGKMRVVPNGVSGKTATAPEEKARLRELLALPPHAPVVLSCSALEKRKGVYDIADACARLATKEYTLVMAGSGPADENIQSYYRERGLGDVVRFPGVIRDEQKDCYFRCADVFLLPTYAEGMPNALLEAMSYGLPAVTTPVGGIPEMLDAGQDGILVAPGDVNALAAAIDELIGNPERRNAMSGRLREKVRERYDWGVVANQIGAVYAELLQDRN